MSAAAKNFHTILDGLLYLGSQESAVFEQGKNDLQNLGIGAICNCTQSFPCSHPKPMEYTRVNIADTKNASILEHLDAATSFIHKYIQKGIGVLVHCQMGVSRSSSVVIAYLMRYHQMTFDQAYDHSKKRRSQVNPNRGFRMQLKIYERELGKSPPNSVETTFDEAWAKQSREMYHYVWKVVAEPKKRCFGELVDVPSHQFVDIANAVLNYIYGNGNDWSPLVEQQHDEQGKTIPLDAAAFLALKLDDKSTRYVCNIVDRRWMTEMVTSLSPEARHVFLNTAFRMLLHDSDWFKEVWAGEFNQDAVSSLREALASFQFNAPPSKTCAAKKLFIVIHCKLLQPPKQSFEEPPSSPAATTLGAAALQHLQEEFARYNNKPNEKERKKVRDDCNKYLKQQFPNASSIKRQTTVTHTALALQRELESEHPVHTLVPDTKHAVEQATVAFESGANGIFLIVHRDDGIAATVAQLNTLYGAVRRTFPTQFIGLNYLGHGPKMEQVVEHLPTGTSYIINILISLYNLIIQSRSLTK